MERFNNLSFGQLTYYKNHENAAIVNIEINPTDGADELYDEIEKMRHNAGMTDLLCKKNSEVYYRCFARVDLTKKQVKLCAIVENSEIDEGEEYAVAITASEQSSLLYKVLTRCVHEIFFVE